MAMTQRLITKCFPDSTGRVVSTLQGDNRFPRFFSEGLIHVKQRLRVDVKRFEGRSKVVEKDDLAHNF